MAHSSLSRENHFPWAHGHHSVSSPNHTSYYPPLSPSASSYQSLHARTGWHLSTTYPRHQITQVNIHIPFFAQRLLPILYPFSSTGQIILSGIKRNKNIDRDGVHRYFLCIDVNIFTISNNATVPVLLPIVP